MEITESYFVRSINQSGQDPAPVPDKFDNYDVTVVVCYFLLVLAIGFYSMCVSNRSTVSGYFLAGRFMFWLPVGASLFASNIGSEHFIGLAGSGAATGLGVAAFELNALVLIQVAGWVFLPVYIASRVCTLPEYMSKRFGGSRIRTYLAVLSLVLYIFTKISVNLFSGAVFINEALHWDLYLSIIVILLMTGICTITGGLTAVIYTDTLQFFIMIIGAAIVATKAFMKVGGMSGLHEKYMKAIPSVTINGTNCGTPREYAFTILRPLDDPDMPWLGFLLGQTPASIWYWCTDQMMVQRLLAAKSLSHAQGGTLFAGFMKILPIFLIVMPGMISRVLFTDEIACVDPEVCMQYCQNPAGCSNIAYPRLVLELMPTGLRGLMMAAMLAALMSDLTSVYNSASTLFTMDIWPQMRKKPPVWELMIVGRSFVVVMILISIAWIPVIQKFQGGQLYIYIQSTAAYLAPPIAAVYLLAILWKRMNETGCFWGMMVGFVVGVIRMVLDFIYLEPQSCGEVDTRPAIIRNMHYLYFAILLFCLTCISSIVISLLTDPPEEFRLIRTTFWTRFEEDKREDDKENFEMSRNDHLQDGMRLNNLSLGESEDMGEEANVPQPIEDPTLIFHLKRLGNWFCGFDQSTGNKTEFYQHLAEVSSLRQKMRDKIILNSLLIVALTTAVVTYVYFSVGVY